MICCHICDRWFETITALEQHLNYAAVHRNDSYGDCLYCDRCERTFNSSEALEQHRNKSKSHNICFECSEYRREDFISRADLEGHLVAEHNYCLACQEGFYDAGDLLEHETGRHNMCRVCKKFFLTPANLNGHLQTHQPRDKECPKCPRMFQTLAAVFLHIDQGACVNGADTAWVDSRAVEYRDLWEYIDQNGSQIKYQCPSCQVGFYCISGLYQHVASGFCGEDYHTYHPLRKFASHLHHCY